MTREAAMLKTERMERALIAAVEASEQCGRACEEAGRAWREFSAVVIAMKKRTTEREKGAKK